MRKSLQWIVLLKSITTGIFAPVLALALLAHGADIRTLSLVIGCYAFTVIVAEFPTGLFADLYGRKTAFLISCVLSVASYAIILLAHSALPLVAGVMVSGLGRAFASGSIDALAVDDVEGDAAIARVSARLSILDSVGLAVGSLAGGLLAGIGEGYIANLGVNLGISALLFPITLLMVHEAKRTGAAPNAGGIAAQSSSVLGDVPMGAGAILSGTDVAEVVAAESRFAPEAATAAPSGWRAFLVQARQSLGFVVHSRMSTALFLLAFFTGVGLAAMETYWQPALESLAPAPWLLGAVSFLGFFSVIVGSKLTEKRMVKRPQTGLTFVLAQKVLTALCLGLLILPTGAGGFLGVYMGVYLFLGLGNVTESTLLNREAPSAQRAGILSLYSFVVQVGSLFSSLMGYFISRHADFRLTWVAGAVMLVLASAVVAARRKARGTGDGVV